MQHALNIVITICKWPTLANFSGAFRTPCTDIWHLGREIGEPAPRPPERSWVIMRKVLAEWLAKEKVVKCSDLPWLILTRTYFTFQYVSMKNILLQMTSDSKNIRMCCAILDSQKHLWVAQATFSNQVSHLALGAVVRQEGTSQRMQTLYRYRVPCQEQPQKIVHLVLPTAFEIKLLIKNSQSNSLALTSSIWYEPMKSVGKLCWATQRSWHSPATATAAPPTQVQQVRQVFSRNQPFAVAKAATTSTVMLHGAASDAPRLATMHCIETLGAPSETQCFGWNDCNFGYAMWIKNMGTVLQYHL